VNSTSRERTWTSLLLDHFNGPRQKDATTGTRKKVTISKDDGIRYGTTKDTLLKIRSAFPQWPPARTTGGNASQVSDGAAAVLLMTRKKAEELGLRVLAKYANIAISGGW